GLLHPPAKPSRALLPARHRAKFEHALGRVVLYRWILEVRSEFAERFTYRTQSEAQLCGTVEHKCPASDHIQPDGLGWIRRITWRSHDHTRRRWRHGDTETDRGGIPVALSGRQRHQDQPEPREFSILVLV